MLVKPKDREAVCHASAWDMGNRKDYRYVRGPSRFLCLSFVAGGLFLALIVYVFVH